MIYYIQDKNTKAITSAICAEPQNKIADFAAYEICREEDFDIVNGFDGKRYFRKDTESPEYLKRKEEHLKARDIEDLRKKREEECFSVINRGTLWYEQLTAEQKNDLKN